MRSPVRALCSSALVLFAGNLPTTASAQDRLERIDPARVEENRPKLPTDAEAPPPPPITREGPGTPNTGASPSAVVLSHVTIAGLVGLRTYDFDGIVKPYLGRPVGTDDLRALVNAVVKRVRDEGYIFASARIPPQSVEGGVLTITVDQGRVDGVRIQGSDDAFLRALLQPLLDGPVTRERLERQLLLASDGLGARIGQSEYDRTDAGRILTVKAERDPVVGQASIDNWGSSFVGPVRARLSAGAGHIFDGADELRASLSFTPFQPREYIFGRLAYARRFGTDGLEASVSGSYGYTRPGAILRRRELRGESVVGTAQLSYPVLRSRQASVWSEVGLGLRRSRQEQFGVVVRDDRLTTLNAGVFGLTRLGDARAFGRITATQGIDLFGATDRGDPNASRSDASGRFTSLYGRASVVIPIVERLEVELSGEGQIASRPLLSSEEFGIGGADIGRGYDYSERLGDEGVAGSAELRYTIGKGLPVIKQLQLLAFADGGVTRDLGVRLFDGSIASAGFGAQIDLPMKLTARITVGVPLTGPRDEDGSSSPRLGFVLGTRF